MDSLCEHKIESSIDGAHQPFAYWLPSVQNKVPVVIALHTWSGDYRRCEYLDLLFNEASRRNWLYLQPNFRGPNRTPQAYGSQDGHKGSVPSEQTIRAFNAIAKELKTTQVSDTEIQELWKTGIIEDPNPPSKNTKPSTTISK